jgi:hypothetical protein
MTTFKLYVKILSLQRGQESDFNQVKNYTNNSVQLSLEDRSNSISVLTSFRYPALTFSKKNDTGALVSNAYLDQKSAEALVEVTVDDQKFDKFDDFQNYVRSKIEQGKLNACAVSTPQAASQTGGKTHTTFKGRSYVIRTGARGGKYIVVKGKTHYV